MVDRLLASPRYGERWGRHWLDVARYADTKGYVFNQETRYPYSYTYRDYVIGAFNDDLPYDRFVVEQIAADRLPLGEDRRPLAAMGFLTVGRRFLNDNNEIIDDRIDVVTRGLLGLSVTCARCHDHKFDPVPTEDYYSLHGVFASSVEPGELPLLPTAGPRGRQGQLPRRNARPGSTPRRTPGPRGGPGSSRNCATTSPPSSRPASPSTSTRSAPGSTRWPAPIRCRPSGSASSARRLGKLFAKAGDPNDPMMGPWVRFAALPEAEFARPVRRGRPAADGADPAHPVDPAVVALFAAPAAPPQTLAEVRPGTASCSSGRRSRQPRSPQVGPPSVVADPALASFVRKR